MKRFVNALDHQAENKDTNRQLRNMVLHEDATNPTDDHENKQIPPWRRNVVLRTHHVCSRRRVEKTDNDRKLVKAIGRGRPHIRWMGENHGYNIEESWEKQQDTGWLETAHRERHQKLYNLTGHHITCVFIWCKTRFYLVAARPCRSSDFHKHSVSFTYLYLFTPKNIKRHIFHYCNTIMVIGEWKQSSLVLLLCTLTENGWR